jgi:aryl-alcohol dehydrogenase-like predicted oxidoreductase
MGALNVGEPAAGGPGTTVPVGRRPLGREGLVVSDQGLGCMGLHTGEGPDGHAEAVATVDRALELGITFFDTADVYGPHVNEELVGEALAGRRDDVVIATKFGNVVDPEAPNGRRIDGRPSYVRESVEGSLRRLGIDHIDLYYQHRVDPTVPIEETVGALSELVAAGKIRYIGLSEAGPGTIRRAHAVHPVSAVQTEWSLWSRDIEDEVVPVARELGIGLVPYSPLGRGALTGAYRTLADVPAPRLRHPRFRPDAFERNRALVAVVEEVAAGRGVTAAQVALAWVHARGDDVVPIPGTKRRRTLDENVGALGVRLDVEELARLDGLAARVVGDRAINPEAVGREAPLPAATPG